MDNQVDKERLYYENKLRRLNEMRTNCWVYIFFFLLCLISGSFYLYISHNSIWGLSKGRIVITAFICFAIFLFICVYWNLCIEILRSKYRRFAVEEEINKMPQNIDLDIDKNLIKISFKYLDQYYLQTREHAQKGFVVTITVSIIGAIIMSIGIIALFFNKVNPAYITTASGVIIEFISAIYFYIYNKTVQGMSSYHNKLVLSQNIALALKLSESLNANKDDAKMHIINELIKDINVHIER